MELKIVKAKMVKTVQCSQYLFFPSIGEKFVEVLFKKAGLVGYLLSTSQAA